MLIHSIFLFMDMYKLTLINLGGSSSCYAEDVRSGIQAGVLGKQGLCKLPSHVICLPRL